MRSQGQQQERLLGMYVASYRVGAVYWQDATTLVLADTGGSHGRPHIYVLKLHGMQEPAAGARNGVKT